MRRSSTKVVWGAGSIVLLLAGLAACGSSHKVGSTTITSANTGSTTPSSVATGTPIVIGNVSAVTGPLANTLSQQQVGVQAWVDYINANGGLNGHPVRLVKYDSKSDPTAEAAGFQTLEASSHPVAFVGVGAFNPQGANAYLTQQKIPVIGGQIADNIFDTSPAFFSEGTSNVALSYGIAAASAGKKFGVVYCTESAQCAQSAQLLKVNAGLTNTSVVYSQKISLATPDFTATCLAAQGAGVQDMVVLFDTPDILRFAKQCSQQNFSPTYIWSGLLPDNKTPSQPGMNGAITIQSNLPWWVTSGSGAAFHTAMQTYFAGATILPSTMQGWASGVLFQKAADAVLQSGGTVTSTSLLSALASLPATNLDGLAPGTISFGSSTPKTLHTCWFTGVVQGGQWTLQGSFSCVPQSAMAKLQAQLSS